MTDPVALTPRAGDVWMAYLDPVVGHEQRENRPDLIVSANWFNDATGGSLVLTVPITTTYKPYLTRVPIHPPEANLPRESWAMCEQPRTLSFERFQRKRGDVAAQTLDAIRTMLIRILRDSFEEP